MLTRDVSTTDKDECVTVKSPASNILVESVYCNWSGGCAIGSLGADTAISNIEYNHIYTQNSNQMLSMSPPPLFSLVCHTLLIVSLSCLHRLSCC